MNDLVLSQKKRIERSQKKKANDPKFDKSHEMLTRSDPRIDVYELRSRSIPRVSWFFHRLNGLIFKNIRLVFTPL